MMVITSMQKRARAWTRRCSGNDKSMTELESNTTFFATKSCRAVAFYFKLTPAQENTNFLISQLPPALPGQTVSLAFGGACSRSRRSLYLGLCQSLGGERRRGGGGVM